MVDWIELPASGSDRVALTVNEKRKTLGDEREAYSPPKLKVFGPVGALTQSGTGASPEDVMTVGQGMFVCTGGPNRQQMC